MIVPNLRHRTIAKRLERASSGPSGYGSGGGGSGGPAYADAYGTKKGPSPQQLIEGYKQLIFACAELNALGVGCLNMHLMAASGNGMEKPRSRSCPMPVLHREKKRIMKLPYVRRAFNVNDVEDVQEITQSVFLDSLEQPAVDPKTELSYFDRQSWVATIVRYIDIVGLSFVKPENENGVGLRSLVASQIPPPIWWPLQSQYVWPIREPNNALVQKFRYFNSYYEPGDLCFIRFRPSLRDPYGAGYAAAQAAWQYSGLEDKGISMWDQLLGTGARPNLIVAAKDADRAPGEDERKRFESELNAYHSRGRAGRSLVTSGAFDFHAMQYQGFDTGEMKLNEYMMERICNCFGVPCSYMTRESNLANFQAGDKFHAKYGINPRAYCIASVLTDIVKKYDPRLFWTFDNPIAEDELQEATIVDMQVKGGLISRNQATQDTPWPPDPDGDDLFMPGTQKTPAMILEAHEASLKAQEAAVKQGDAQLKQGDKKINNDAKAAGIKAKQDKAKAAKSEKRAIVRANQIMAKMEEMINA